MEGLWARFQARMDEKRLKPADIDRLAGFKPGSTREYIKRGQTPSVDRAASLAAAVGWTLQQFFDGVQTIRLNLHIDGVTRGQGMWQSISGSRAEVLPIELYTESLVSIKISDDNSAPSAGLRRGDIVVGSKSFGRGIGNLIHTECIICTTDERNLLGVLHQGSKVGLYDVILLQPRAEPIRDVKIEWADPIQLIVRGQG